MIDLYIEVAQNVKYCVDAVANLSGLKYVKELLLGILTNSY